MPEYSPTIHPITNKTGIFVEYNDWLELMLLLDMPPETPFIEVLAAIRRVTQPPELIEQQYQSDFDEEGHRGG